MAGERTISMGPTGTPVPNQFAQPMVGPVATLSVEPSAFLWNVPMVVLTLLVLTHFGRIFDFILVGYKVPLVICATGVLVTLTTRGAGMIKSPPGVALAALVCCMAISAPFSIWKGGSASTVLYFIGLEVVLLLMSASAPRSLGDIRKVGYTLIVCYGLYVFAASLNKTSERFTLKGTYGNSDDLSLLIGFILPFVVLFALQLRNPPLRILTLIVGGGIMVRAILLTGTRAALAALGAIIIVYFLRASGSQRVGLVALAVVGGILAIAILPADIRSRFSTITHVFNSETVLAESSQDEAMASVAARKDLLLDALRMIKAHPLLGVGPGEYPDYRVKMTDNTTGANKLYFTAHNSYLELAAECGIPASFIYIIFLGLVYWTIRKGINLNRRGAFPGWEEGYRIGVALETSFLFFVICAAFMNCERYPHQFLIAGMALALVRISEMRNARRLKTSVPSETLGYQLPPARVSPVGAENLSATPAARSRSALRRSRGLPIR